MMQLQQLIRSHCAATDEITHDARAVGYSVNGVGSERHGVAVERLLQRDNRGKRAIMSCEATRCTSTPTSPRQQTAVASIVGISVQRCRAASTMPRHDFHS